MKLSERRLHCMHYVDNTKVRATGFWHIVLQKHFKDHACILLEKFNYMSLCHFFKLLVL